MHPPGAGLRAGCSGRTSGLLPPGGAAMTTRRGDLEDVIGAVAASYAAGRLIDSLSSAQLPSKRQVIEALGHLKAVMYLGYYATGSLDEARLRFAVAAHLYPAYDILVEQIRRAASYEGFRNAGLPREPDWPEAVSLALLRRIPELRTLLSKDVLAAFQGDPAANSVEEVIFSYPSIEAITVHRIAHELYREGVPMLPRIMSEHAHATSGIDIHPGASIGESFFIDHGTGVVIGETCTIGNNVKIYQGVTLGALSLERGLPGKSDGKRHPTIEDDVTIYAGATILGGETVIGAGSVIGGNVWLVHSVPPGSRISYEGPPPR
jgi:serine O-acetyltransferase